MRCCTAMPPPSALMRSILGSEIVSQWSKNQCSPSRGTSRFTFSKIPRNRLIDSCLRHFRDDAFPTHIKDVAVRLHGANHFVGMLIACPVALELQQYLQGGYRH